MVAVQTNIYDAGASGGDGNTTLQTLPVDSNPANDRNTAFAYDWRNRQIRVTAAQDWYQVSTLDNINHAVLVQQYAQATNTLIRQSATNYDNRGRAYQHLRYGVDPSTGTAGNVLTDNTWFDPSSNVLMTLPAGSQAFTKSVFDELSRQTAQYVGYYSDGVNLPLPSGEGRGEGGLRRGEGAAPTYYLPTYAQALDISGATIVEQTETLWDAASNAIQTTFRQRFHNATGLGPLTQPGGAQPQARVMYAAMYPDGIARNQAVADYGTNGDVPLTRSDTIPTNSASVHVSLTLYNNRGEPDQSIDAMGTVTQTTLDDAGRRVQLIRNYQSGQPSTGDVNVTVQWAWTADDQTATMTAINAATGDQLTQFVFGTTLGTSDVARNDVLAATVYADGGTVSYLLNRQSERKQLTDQNGTVHAYGFDLLANPISDSVVALGAGIDGAVRRIGRTYDVRGLLEHITSFSDAAGTNVVNDILRVYNPFEQCVKEYQEHDGAVSTSTSVVVGYQYADGSANTIRPTGLVYPNGRVITLDYGTAGGIDDALSRVANLIDDDGSDLVSYTRIGLDTFVQQVSAQPQIAWSLINGNGIDPYTGLDQFNQIVDNRWYNTATSADLDRIQHGYDLAGNRLYRRNTVAEAAGINLDELYAHDGLYRLARLDRGQLNSTNTGIVSGTEDFTQAWILDTSGNWSTFNQADTGATWTLEQTRSANPANEITSITGGGWAQPAYDAAGNTVRMPQPNSPAAAYQAVYDAWNRMMAVSSGDPTIQRNAYDGLTRRITNLVAGGLRHSFFSIEWRLLEERVGASPSPDSQCVWGQRYIDGILLRDRGVERLYAMQDPNWNVDAIAGANGEVLERYSFAAYGRPAFFNAEFAGLPGSAYEWVSLFAGYRWDSNTGLYVVRQRYLQSAIGGWCARDPLDTKLRLFEGSYSAAPLARDRREERVTTALLRHTNLYVYARGNPLEISDPTGLTSVKNCAPSSVKPRPGYTVPPPNGCGGEGSSFPVPDAILWVDFGPCCDRHDNCYGTCKAYGGSKGTCDTAFLACLTDKCSTAFFWYSSCVLIAHAYYRAVSAFGSPFYDAGQEAACVCCPPQRRRPHRTDPGISLNEACWHYCATVVTAATDAERNALIDDCVQDCVDNPWGKVLSR